MCYLSACSVKSLLISSAFLTVLYWFLLVPLLFEYLDARPETRSWPQHWIIIYFALVFLLWGVLMFLIVGIWYLCQNHFKRKLAIHDSENELIALNEDRTLVQVNEKVRRTMGLDEDLPGLTKSVLRRNSSQFLKSEAKKRESADGFEENTRNTRLSHLKLGEAEVTPLPEYSPEAKSSIFEFPDGPIDDEIMRSSSPFQEFLHLVKIESPKSPEKTFEQEITDALKSSVAEKCKSYGEKTNVESTKPKATEKYPAPIITDTLLKQPHFKKKKVSIINEADEEENEQSTEKGELSMEEKSSEKVEGTVTDEEILDEDTEELLDESPKKVKSEKAEGTVTDEEILDEGTEELLDESSKKVKPVLAKQESCMSLGKIGRVGSDVTEMFFNVSKGVPIVDSIIVTGRSQILKSPLP